MNHKNGQDEHDSPAFLEPHHGVAYWSELWALSAKTIRSWFRDEHGPGILRIASGEKRGKRSYITLKISLSAAERVYAARTAGRGLRRREVM